MAPFADFYTLICTPTQSFFFPYSVAGNAIETLKKVLKLYNHTRDMAKSRNRYTVHKIEIEVSMLNIKKNNYGLYMGCEIYISVVYVGK